MTRRQVVLVVMGCVLAVLVPIVLAAGALWSVLPNADQARTSSQAAADRVLPGVLRVVGADGRGEAGGYQVVAELVVDPSVTVVWSGDRHCRPDSLCELRMITAVADVRDRAAERGALERAFRACGLPPRGEPSATHQDPITGAADRWLDSSVTVTLPLADLDGAGMARATTRLDACAVAWSAQRARLLPVHRYTASVALGEPDGQVHSAVDVVVVDGRVDVSAAATLQPTLGTAAREALLGRLETPVRAFVRGQGSDVARFTGVETVYASGTTRILVARVTVALRPVDPTQPDVAAAVLLTTDAEGITPTGLRLVPIR